MSYELGHLTQLVNWSLEVSWENNATFGHFILCSIERKLSDFTGDPVVKDPPANAGWFQVYNILEKSGKK